MNPTQLLLGRLGNDQRCGDIAPAFLEIDLDIRSRADEPSGKKLHHFRVAELSMDKEVLRVYEAVAQLRSKNVI